jgi:tRNA(Arg) A34 adenosine deaminase TadA
MTREQDLALLRRAIEIAEKAKADGNHPFGALLADAAGKIIIEQGNVFTTLGSLGHAESEVARRGAEKYSPEELAKMTLYTSVEPCAMCTGTLYWAGIGALVFGMTEKRLLEMTGNHAENPTINLPSRTVLAAGQRAVEVRGPFGEVEDDIAKAHQGFWR